jgi:hypothetical protein
MLELMVITTPLEETDMGMLFYYPIEDINEEL